MKKSHIAIALGIALPMLASKQGGKNTKPKAIFLIGLPSVGKSSLIKKEGWDKDPNTFIHSTDNIVNEIAKREGITYDDFFASGRFVQDVLPILQERFQEAIKNGKNIVVDMVNESKAKRDLTLKDLPENYTKEAIVIGHEQWINQNPSFLQKIKDAVLERKTTTGKSIPPFVLDSMFSSYEVPSEDEGFTVIEMIEPLNPLVKGSANKDDIKVLRVEKRRSKWGGKEHMKAMSRGRMFNPGEKNCWVGNHT